MIDVGRPLSYDGWAGGGGSRGSRTRGSDERTFVVPGSRPRPGARRSRASTADGPAGAGTSRSGLPAPGRNAVGPGRRAAPGRDPRMGGRRVRPGGDGRRGGDPAGRRHRRPGRDRRRRAPGVVGHPGDDAGAPPGLPAPARGRRPGGVPARPGAGPVGRRPGPARRVLPRPRRWHRGRRRRGPGSLPAVPGPAAGRLGSSRGVRPAQDRSDLARRPRPRPVGRPARLRRRRRRARVHRRRCGRVRGRLRRGHGAGRPRRPRHRPGSRRAAP